jgi:hypothetical protein
MERGRNGAYRHGGRAGTGRTMSVQRWMERDRRFQSWIGMIAGGLVLALSAFMAIGAVLGSDGPTRQGTVVAVDDHLRVVRANVVFADGTKVTAEVNAWSPPSVGDVVAVDEGDTPTINGSAWPFVAVTATAGLVFLGLSAAMRAATSRSGSSAGG